MTIFIVSLFLPVTVNFEVDDAEHPNLAALRRNPSQVRLGDYQTLPLASEPAVTPVIHEPEASEGSEEDFFTMGHAFSAAARGHSRQSSSQTISSTDLPVVTPSESQPPAWGQRGNFVQPRPRALSIPSVSVIDFGRSPLRRAPIDPDFEIEEENRNRRIKTAEWSIHPAEHGNGGLRNAVHAACMANTAIEKTWVGTLGMPTDALTEEQKMDIAGKLGAEFDCLTLFPSDRDLKGHYTDYCKTILWPILHSQAPGEPKSKAYEDHSWEYYVKVNQLFADAIVKDYKKDDVIWIHDYHLLLVPGMLRKVLPDAQIGLFIHTPFPSSELIRCLPVRELLLRSMLDTNLVGFHIHEYCYHFLQTASRLLFVEAKGNGVQLETRFVNVGAFPIGLALDGLNQRRDNDEVKDWLSKLSRKFAGKKLIVARDKVDPVRGIRQKLLAYEQLLKSYPELIEEVVLIQIATASTPQKDLESALRELVTRINSKFAILGHQPLLYIEQDIPYSQWLALLSLADAFVITSLRDGMSLGSHEFICCQDGMLASSKKHGSLVLSEFTGSSSIFKGMELPVNPWDLSQCTEAMRKALSMPEDEKSHRWTQLMKLVQENDGARWFTSFIDSLKSACNEQNRQDTVSIPRLSVTKLCEEYCNSKVRLFMLDYEGTLVCHEAPTTMQFARPQMTIDGLKELISKEGNIVYVMTNKSPMEMHRLFARVPGLGMVAENGCCIKFHDAAEDDDWIEAADMKKIGKWQDSIAKMLSYYRDRTDGSTLEIRHCSIVFHTQKVLDQSAVSRILGECAEQINGTFGHMNIQAVPVETGLLVQSTERTKATAAARVFERIQNTNLAKGLENPSFLMVAGDSRDDEAMYRWANNISNQGLVRHVSTVSVSSRNTEAMATLTQGVTGILSALQQLAAAK